MIKSINSKPKTAIQKKNERMLNFYKNYEKYVVPKLKDLEIERKKHYIQQYYCL